MILTKEYEERAQGSERKGFCNTHPGIPCVAYCETDGEPICLECVITHDGHKRVNLVEARQGQLAIFDANQKSLTEAIGNYAGWAKKLSLDRDEKKKTIDEYFDYLIKKLSEKKVETLTLLDKMFVANETNCQNDLGKMNELLKRMNDEVVLIEQIKLNKISKKHLDSLYVPEECGRVTDGFHFEGNALIKNEIENCVLVSQKETALTIQQRIKLSAKSTCEFVEQGPYSTGCRVETTMGLIDDAGNKIACHTASAIKVNVTADGVSSLPLQFNGDCMSFVPLKEGKYTMTIEINGKTLAQSPWIFDVVSSAPATLASGDLEVSTLKNGVATVLKGEFVSVNQPDAVITIKTPKKIRVNKYTLKSLSLRSWVFEGFHNDQWIPLKQHSHDYKWNDGIGSWELPTADLLLNTFRIRQTGKNALGGRDIILSGIELTGLVAKK